eukprot:1954571-Rhodomonas_salina.2
MGLRACYVVSGTGLAAYARPISTSLAAHYRTRPIADAPAVPCAMRSLGGAVCGTELVYGATQASMKERGKKKAAERKAEREAE